MLNYEKCVIYVSQVELLGHVIDATGIRLLPAHMCRPSTPSSAHYKGRVAALLGDDQLLQEIPQWSASILKPLTGATRGVGGCQTSLWWDQGMQRAFTASKAALAQAAELIHPNPTAEISLAVDVSYQHVVGILQ